MTITIDKTWALAGISVGDTVTIGDFTYRVTSISGKTATVARA